MDYKSLFRKLEKTLARIEPSANPVATLSAILRLLLGEFREELGLTAGRIYVRRGSAYVLEDAYPEQAAHAGFRIPASYDPIRELLRRGWVYRDVRDPGVDRAIESALGVKDFAAIGIGDRARQIAAFSLRRGSDPEHIIYALNTIRLVINLKLRQVLLEDRVAQVREIQLSLLPKSVPKFGDYDIWGQTVPAEEVGGDLFDYIPVSQRSLGVAVVDSSGHGLPAALQARDAIIGLRMGVEERLRITAAIEKLNRVISHSALASKFISLFYAELELNGNLVYCNAGHTPALLLREGRIFELSRGGLLLGPNPAALYERGYDRMEPGSVLLIYTDGITDAEDSCGATFDKERIKEILLGERFTSARQLVERIFEAVRSFSATDPPEDDQTVLAVVRKPLPERSAPRS